MVTANIPEHMTSYKEARMNAGLTDKICIDPCIHEEIKYLWSQGVKTYGSCCGHNEQESFVNVDESNIDLMLGLGYIQNHPDKNRKDTFKLKSA